MMTLASGNAARRFPPERCSTTFAAKLSGTGRALARIGLTTPPNPESASSVPTRWCDRTHQTPLHVDGLRIRPVCTLGGVPGADGVPYAHAQGSGARGSHKPGSRVRPLDSPLGGSSR